MTYALGVPVPLGYVGRCRRPLPTAAVERELLVLARLLEAELLLELLGREVEGVGEDRKREVDSRRNRALHNLVGLADVDQVCILQSASSRRYDAEDQRTYGAGLQRLRLQLLVRDHLRIPVALQLVPRLQHLLPILGCF